MLDLVSVIIPVYNTEKYIQETIESVLNQTYKNIEIIAVNDGSTDQSLEILEKLKNKALNKIIIHNQKNQGQTKSRNNGVELANGKFLLFLDSDDKIDPTYIEKCVSLLNQKKTIDLVYTKTCFFDQKQGEWNLGKFETKRFLKENCIPVTAMIRRENFLNLGKFDEKLTFFEDWELWIRLVKNGGEIYQIPENLFFYRKRKTENSLSNNAYHNLKMLDENKFCIYNKHYEFYVSNDLGISLLFENHRYKEKYYNVWYKKIFRKLKNK